MSEEITLTQLQDWLRRYAELIEAQESYLSELDAAIGDGDHGANMMRGMETVRTRLHEEQETEATVSTLMRNVAMTLISSVGGAAGPLYGAFFLRAAKDAGNSQSITLVQLAHMFHSGLEGVQQRGKAVATEKTMIDAMLPAVDALAKAADDDQSVAMAVASAAAAAEGGMKETIMMQATKGRASYLGARSIGHQDPGATSTYYLFLAAKETLG
ncbi:MAG: dihydroxyacetone kinase subunit L [Caldilineaceae bacterium]|nr:dihydroxyacetone kinase subunit L [Caldilineaceae bacterium]